MLASTSVECGQQAGIGPLSVASWTVGEPAADYGPRPQRLLDQVRESLRARHYSERTEDAYASWIGRFILFHDKPHPPEMGEPEINAFLTDLAVTRRFSASTQNQALAAVLFLYRHVPVLGSLSIAEYSGGLWQAAVRGTSTLSPDRRRLSAGMRSDPRHSIAEQGDLGR
jgi:hypothetical protein